MKISKVKTATKIGDFVVKENHRNKINIEYLSHISKDVLNDNVARIYLFVVDRIIKKIGGSSSKGGIKSTINLYTTSQTGSPGVPRFVLHLLLAEALMKKSKVELYMITSPKVLATVNGLFGSKKVKIASYKEMENFCKSDYFSKENRYPDWNFQENHEHYPVELARQHNIYHRKRLRKKKKSK